MNYKKILGSMALVATVAASTTAPLSAQPAQGWQSGNRMGSEMWRGAPDGLQQRIDWLQQRIERGRTSGSLSREEARRAQMQLDTLRRDANLLQQRLDGLSRNIRWARNDGGYGGGGQGGGYQGGYGAGAYRAPASTDYDAYRYYRDDPRYTERQLSPDDEVYRGSDGRYYCKRSDGTTGLIIGAVGGGVLGNVIDGGSNRVAGTLIGGALGAFLGKSVDQNNANVRCR